MSQARSLRYVFEYVSEFAATHGFARLRSTHLFCESASCAVLPKCMACSDNVVRGGLTDKVQDVDTLVAMLTYK